jgi:hypothetical protein
MRGSSRDAGRLQSDTGPPHWGHYHGYHTAEAPDNDPQRLTFRQGQGQGEGEGRTWVPTFESLTTASSVHDSPEPYNYGRLSSSLSFPSGVEGKYGDRDKDKDKDKDMGRDRSAVRSDVNGGAGFATAYCLGFSSGLDSCVCPLMEADIAVVYSPAHAFPAPPSSTGNGGAESSSSGHSAVSEDRGRDRGRDRDRSWSGPDVQAVRNLLPPRGKMHRMQHSTGHLPHGMDGTARDPQGRQEAQQQPQAKLEGEGEGSRRRLLPSDKHRGERRSRPNEGESGTGQRGDFTGAAAGGAGEIARHLHRAIPRSAFPHRQSMDRDRDRDRDYPDRHPSHPFPLPKTHSEIGGPRVGEQEAQQEHASVSAAGVTLITVGWAHEFVSGALQSTVTSWEGPVLVVLARSDSERPGETRGDNQPRGEVNRKEDPSAGFTGVSNEDVARAAAELSVDRAAGASLTVLVTDIGACKSHIFSTGTGTSSSAPLPDNALFNLGMDAAATDIVCLCPRGASFRRLRGTDGGDGAAGKDVRDQLHLAQSLADSQVSARGRAPLDLLPVALVVPAYSITSTSARESHPPSSPHQGTCGAQQSQRLRQDYYRRSFALQGSARPDQVFTPLDFDALELTRRHTVMPAVVFDRRASVHGDSFVRLPEEWSGEGCYGSAVVRILAGSGYTVRWAGFHTFVEASSSTVDSSAGGSETCGCSHIPTPTAEAEEGFLASFLGYYARAVELRVRGVEDVYAREAFAGRFEREQRELQSRVH